jgi:hypothetical protein
MRQSMTQAERRDKFQTTHEVATSIIQSQRAARAAKTARLRELRLQMEAEAEATAKKAASKRRSSSH